MAAATRSYRCLETGLETPPHLYSLPYTTFFEILRALFFICGAADEGFVFRADGSDDRDESPHSFQPKREAAAPVSLCGELYSLHT